MLSSFENPDNHNKIPSIILNTYHASNPNNLDNHKSHNDMCKPNFIYLDLSNEKNISILAVSMNFLLAYVF